MRWHVGACDYPAAAQAARAAPYESRGGCCRSRCLSPASPQHENSAPGLQRRMDSPSAGRGGADRRTSAPARRRRLPRRRARLRAGQKGRSSEPAPCPSAGCSPPRSRRARPRSRAQHLHSTISARGSSHTAQGGRYASGGGLARLGECVPSAYCKYGAAAVSHSSLLASCSSISASRLPLLAQEPPNRARGRYHAPHAARRGVPARPGRPRGRS
jgi:hypothetical protein